MYHNIPAIITPAFKFTVQIFDFSGYTSTTVDYQLLDNVGYIRIRQFDGTTPSELDYALRTLTANGAASLVFDLRDNGGGILEDAVNCIDLIAPEGTVAYACLLYTSPSPRD